jgi:hypothetical protein
MAIVAAESREKPAARLFGAAKGLRDVLGPDSRRQSAIWQRGRAERALASVRARLGEERFAAAWAEGEALNIEHASAYALDLADTGRHRSSLRSASLRSIRNSELEVRRASHEAATNAAPASKPGPSSKPARAGADAEVM